MEDVPKSHVSFAVFGQHLLAVGQDSVLLDTATTWRGGGRGRGGDIREGRRGRKGGRGRRRRRRRREGDRVRRGERW